MRFFRVDFWALLAVLCLSGGVACADEGSLTGFLGRFHPVVLHLPIGAILGLFLLELVVWPTGDARRGDVGRWVLLAMGAVTAGVASVFGLFQSWEASYDAHLVWEHKVTGIGVSVTVGLALLFRIGFSLRDSRRALWAYRLMVLASAGLLFPAGHHGGQLTHGRDFLSRDIPASLAFLAPLLGGGGETVELAENYFNDEILPILERTCFECHSAVKQEGELRMDTLEGCTSAGESGKPCLVPEHIGESYMIELLLLPPEHEDVMPPVGKPAIEPEEILTLATWISRGAPWGDYTPPEPEPEAETGEESEVDVAAVDGAGAAQVMKADVVMEMLFEEPPARMAEALAVEPADRKARRELLKVVFNEANLLAEVHNLLFSQTEEEYMLTPEWTALTVEGRDAAVAVAEYLKDRKWEYEELKARYVGLVESCNKCHRHFELETDPIEAWPAPEE